MFGMTKQTQHVISNVGSSVVSKKAVEDKPMTIAEIQAVLAGRKI